MLNDLDPMPERIYVAKIRHCLMCRDPFESIWSGERVCRRCKGREDWRTGNALASNHEVGNRR